MLGAGISLVPGVRPRSMCTSAAARGCSEPVVAEPVGRTIRARSDQAQSTGHAAAPAQRPPHIKQLPFNWNQYIDPICTHVKRDSPMRHDTLSADAGLGLSDTGRIFCHRRAASGQSTPGRARRTMFGKLPTIQPLLTLWPETSHTGVRSGDARASLARGGARDGVSGKQPSDVRGIAECPTCCGQPTLYKHAVRG